jgi:hypothetical protein
MASDRVSVKLNAETYTEISMLAADFRVGIGDVMEMLLEYALADVERVMAAWSLRGEDGADKVRKRRQASQP